MGEQAVGDFMARVWSGLPGAGFEYPWFMVK